jgi:nicotinate phosphoribosyltransferase
MIYETLLDDDLYKYTMGSAFWHMHRDVKAQYVYKCRSTDVDLSIIQNKLIEEISYMEDVVLNKQEADWLYKNTRVTQDYIQEFLRPLRRDAKQLIIKNDKSANGGISIATDPDVPLCEASLWEMPVMSIISELYFKELYGSKYDKVIARMKRNLESSASKLLSVIEKEESPVAYTFSEFGTRRRISREFQRWSLEMLSDKLGDHLVGTSNMRLAKEKDITAVGTMAHEWIMLYQALVHPVDSQKKAIEDWIEFYRGWNGIVLTDTLGSKKWEKDFDAKMQKLYIGQRHDSGDPYEWAEKRIQSYLNHNIYPRDKTLLFSDGLDLMSSYRLSQAFSDRINVTHGIGTSLSNPKTNIPGIYHSAISQVFKISRVNGRPVAKLSDNPDKAQCPDNTHLEYMKWASKQ